MAGTTVQMPGLMKIFSNIALAIAKLEQQKPDNLVQQLGKLADIEKKHQKKKNLSSGSGFLP